MHGHGAALGAVEPVDVVRPEGERTAGAHPCLAAGRADAQVVLDQLAGDDRDGAGGDVVVVPPGVVDGCPAEQPDVDVGVAVQGRIDAFVVVEADQVGPAVRVDGQRRDDLLELAGGQVAVGEVVEGERRRRRW